MSVKIILVFLQIKLLYCFVAFCTIFSVLNAQNLVPNHSFEDAYTCPDSYNNEHTTKIIPGWIVPNKSTPDYFNACTKTDVSVPQNFAGNMNAFDGFSYMGLILKESYNPDETSYFANKDEYSREYISAKLLSPLKRGKYYCLSFYYAQAKNSGYSVDGLGVYFSKEKIKLRNDGVIPAKAYITTKKDKLLSNKNKWEEFCGVFTPKGGEKYITIGNFTPTKIIKYEKTDTTVSASLSKYAYYLVDEIRLYSVENEFECGCSGTLAEVNNLYSVKTNEKIAMKTNNSKSDSNSKITNNKEPENSNMLKNESNSTEGKDENKITGIGNIKAIEDGLVVKLENILFGKEDATLTESSFSELDKLLKIMSENSDIYIEISGHTDNTGSDELNNRLSEQRAKAVARYLAKKGIKKKRISTIGFGRSQPIADNTAEEGRAKNRRVEVKIIFPGLE